MSVYNNGAKTGPHRGPDGHIIELNHHMLYKLDEIATRENITTTNDDYEALILFLIERYWHSER